MSDTSDTSPERSDAFGSTDELLANTASASKRPAPSQLSSQAQSQPAPPRAQANPREPLLRSQPGVPISEEEAARRLRLREARQQQLAEEERVRQEAERELDLKYDADSVLALIKPVSACMIVVIATIRSVTYFSQNDTQFAYTPFESGSGESDGQKFGGALLNALIIIGIVVVMTCVLLVLYMYKYYKVIHGWLMLSSLLLLFFFSYQYIEQVLLAYNRSIDWITLAFVVWNFGAGGFMAIHWRGPLRLQQFYLVAVSALMALVLIKNLPDWTTWVVLAAIAIYDLVAVLSPCGPLKALVETAQEREEPLFPALIYSSGMAWIVTMAKPGDDDRDVESFGTQASNQRRPAAQTATTTDLNERTRSRAQQQMQMRDSQQGAGSVNAPERRAAPPRANAAPEDEEEEESSGVKLGLGDFIFYSVLVGKAATANEWTTITSCYIGILIGLACTLLLLSIYQKALPALPISIFFGIVFFFATSELLDPLLNNLNERQVFI